MSPGTSTRASSGSTWRPLTDPDLVPNAAARALGLAPAPEQPVEEMLARHLRLRQTLLLLDNCEHLAQPVADFIAPLLLACPAVQVLATSRAPLRVRGEHELSVSPLPLPSPHGGESPIDVESNPAVRLFVERARAASSPVGGEAALEDVADICRKLDGLPLAIELAAARTRVLSLPALRDRLDHRLPELEGGPRDAPRRQRTVRDTIAWSYDLLAEPEREAFERLAVFAGGFTLEAARAVAGPDPDVDVLRIFEALVEQHLVRPAPDASGFRYTMLETIREFALERLQARGGEAATRERHATYFADLTRRIDAWVAPYMPNTLEILGQLDVEYANLQSALTWLRQTGQVSALLDLAGSLFFFWQLGWHLREGRAWLEWGLAQNGAIDASARANGQLALSGILYVQSEIAPALTLGMEALDYYRSRGDMPDIARAGDHAACVAIATTWDEDDKVAGPNRALAERLAAEALAAAAKLPEAPWSRRIASHVQHYRACLAFSREDNVEAERIIRDVIAEQEALAREEDAEHAYACWALLLWGHVAYVRGRLPEALARFQAALDRAVRFREERAAAQALALIAAIAARHERWPEAARLAGAAEAICGRNGLAFAEVAWEWHDLVGSFDAWPPPLSPTTTDNRQRANAMNEGPHAIAFEAGWAAGRAMALADAISAAMAIDLARGPSTLAKATTAPSLHGLTRREVEVLALLCERLTDPDIAARLFISPRTAEGHVARIIGKLGVENRRDAAAVAARIGLV